MDRFKKRKSLAGILEPGDGTSYQIVAVKLWDCIEVIIMNEDFFDKITLIDGQEDYYRTFRGEGTNPWTIKAAEKMRDIFLKEKD